MARKLPPLNALKAFEAAARNESLTRAAAELSVSHAAISRHIRDLEKLLRVTLFERTGRGVVLTQPGAALAKSLSEAFDIVANATSRYMRTSRRTQRLTITTDVPFAAMWLVPRLGRFTSGHPHIDIVIDPSPRLVDFQREDIDLGIRFGRGSWRGVKAERLADAELTVVCNPKLLASANVRAPGDLPPELLLQEQDRAHWQAWFETAGAGQNIVPMGPTLLADLTMVAAEAGQGFALADRILALDALAAGRLVCPFETAVRTHGYYLVSSEAGALSKAALSFTSWILSEMERTIAALAGMKAAKPAKALKR